MRKREFYRRRKNFKNSLYFLDIYLASAFLFLMVSLEDKRLMSFEWFKTDTENKKHYLGVRSWKLKEIVDLRWLRS